MSTNTQRKDETVAIKDARLIFKNFSGREDQYNRKGARNFSLVLRKEEADILAKSGWNVKTRDPRDEDDEPGYSLKMNLQFATKGRPPRVVMVGSKNKTALTDDTVHLLDSVNIESADVRFRPYEYEPGKFSAYVVTLFAVIEEDELEDRYSDIPEAGMTVTPSRAPRFEEDDYDN